jgi:phosphomannomutase
MSLTCFKAYDIRGRLGAELDEGIAYRIGRGFAQAVAAETVVLGRDVRPTSEALADAVAQALIDEGVEVLELGPCGTEEVYAATGDTGASGGICITASHNPMDYNGMKLVGAGAAPLDPQGALAEIRRLAEADGFGPAKPGGARRDISAAARAAYVDRVAGFVDAATLGPLKIVVNAGHGAAGPTFDALAETLAVRGAALEFIRIHHAPDPTFPAGIPNPLLPENRPVTAGAVRTHGADFGIAWDGDFDRCFFFDHEGRFVDGEYVVGLLAAAFLAKSPGATIVHDPRVVWNTQDVVARAGGHAVQARTGHAFLKRAMRAANAIYGGEMSAHHYFRDFFFCDSGMIPWLLMADLVSRDGPLANLVAARQAAFPSSGEINFKVADVAQAIAGVEGAFAPDARGIDRTDGVSLDMGDWRFNLRGSNTEPLLRLNVEAKGDRGLVDDAVARIGALIGGL